MTRFDPEMTKRGATHEICCDAQYGRGKTLPSQMLNPTYLSRVRRTPCELYCKFTHVDGVPLLELCFSSLMLLDMMCGAQADRPPVRRLETDPAIGVAVYMGTFDRQLQAGGAPSILAGVHRRRRNPAVRSGRACLVVPRVAGGRALHRDGNSGRDPRQRQDGARQPVARVPCRSVEGRSPASAETGLCVSR